MVAYYCKFYAAKLGLAAGAAADRTELITVLDELEADKQALLASDKYAAMLGDEDAAYKHVASFAMRIFL